MAAFLKTSGLNPKTSKITIVQEEDEDDDEEVEVEKDDGVEEDHVPSSSSSSTTSINIPAISNKKIVFNDSDDSDDDNCNNSNSVTATAAETSAVQKKISKMLVDSKNGKKNQDENDDSSDDDDESNSTGKVSYSTLISNLVKESHRMLKCQPTGSSGEVAWFSDPDCSSTSFLAAAASGGTDDAGDRDEIDTWFHRFYKLAEKLYQDEVELYEKSKFLNVCIFHSSSQSYSPSTLVFNHFNNSS